MRRTNGFKTEVRGRNKIIWGGGEREMIGVFKGARERKINRALLGEQIHQRFSLLVNFSSLHSKTQNIQN